MNGKELGNEDNIASKYLKEWGFPLTNESLALFNAFKRNWKDPLYQKKDDDDESLNSSESHSSYDEFTEHYLKGNYLMTKNPADDGRNVGTKGGNYNNNDSNNNGNYNNNGSDSGRSYNNNNSNIYHNKYINKISTISPTHILST